MTGDGRRAKRVSELVRARVTDALSREVADPRLASLVITDVSVTDDLTVARLSVRLLLDDEDRGARDRALSAVQHAAGRLRTLIGPRLGLRRAPELRFQYDTGLDATRRVEQLLEEIRREPRAPEEE